MRQVLAVLVAAFTAASMVAVPAVVLGHVELTSSSPEAGDNLDTAPSEVSISFDDELDPDLSSFTVTDAGGNEVGSGEVDLTVADRNVLNGSVSITDPGIYTVHYTVAGVDGHVLEGAFSFGFRADEAIPEPTGGESGPDTAMPAPRIPLLPLVGAVLLIVAGTVTARRLRGA
jgi:methionine-rich copper-binding protein CopC